MKSNLENIPHLGYGLGLRTKHYEHIFENWPKIDWLEVISENFIDTEGRPIANLERFAERYLIVMHGVSLGIGTVDPLNSEYLKNLKKLFKRFNPAWVSDHLCWTGVAHKNSHDLLPVPYTEESLKHIVGRIKEVQDFLERPMLFENPSTYLEFKSSHMSEAEFIARMAEESGCGLLLDVNNIYVSCYNHRWNVKDYIDAIPLERVKQIHLSGHTNKKNHIVDTHDNHVIDEVWEIYKYVVKKAGCEINTMVEWDDKIPEFEVLAAELNKAKDAVKNLENISFDEIKLPNLEIKKHRVAVERKLEQEQHKMMNAILSADKKVAEADLWIYEKEDFSANDQLGIYVNGYRYRLFDIVEGEYPVLKRYLGEEKFNDLIKRYIETTNSNTYNAGKYPARLPEYIKNNIADYEEFALEMAIFENAISQLADAKESEVLKPEHLAGISPEKFMESNLYGRDAMEIFKFNYPVNNYYKSFMENNVPQKIEKLDSYVAVYRHENIMWRLELEKDEYNLLQKILSGLNIGDALEQVLNESNLTEEQLSENLGIWFGRWLKNSILANKNNN